MSEMYCTWLAENTGRTNYTSSSGVAERPRDLRFEVEQASRGLSAIAELLVLDYCTVFATLYV